MSQKIEGGGLDAQEHRCRQYAKNKNYEIEEVFLDSFTGAGDFMNRPAMRSMLEYIDNHPHKDYIVIFDDLKRFARDVQFHIKLRSAFKARGVKIECLNYNFDDSPEGEFVEIIMAAQGELERKQNRRQVIQKMKARMERGYWTFYPPPGFKTRKDPVHGKLLVPDEPKASIIKEAMEGYASGRFQEQLDVLRFLKSKNFGDGKVVHLSQVARLLTRIVYAGYIEYPPWEISRRKGHHDGLISLDTFEKIQEKLNGNKMIRYRKDNSSEFPLRGFALCDVCFEPLTASWSHGRNHPHPYYRCRNLKCVRNNKSIRRKDLEDSFRCLLKKLKPKSRVLDLTKEIALQEWTDVSKGVDSGKVKIAEDILKIKSDIKDLIEKIKKATSDSVVKLYENEIDELSKKEITLQDQLQNYAKKVSGVNFETALEVVLTILKNPYEAWENGDLFMKRLMLKLVFSERLAYSLEKGWATAKLTLPLRLFEQISDSNYQGVEKGALKPRANKF